MSDEYARHLSRHFIIINSYGYEVVYTEPDAEEQSVSLVLVSLAARQRIQCIYLMHVLRPQSALQPVCDHSYNL